MNDRYLFRAKCGKTWVYGGYYQTSKGEHFIHNGYHPVKISKKNVNTIGQYLGIYDENGNKIFDGDILRLHDYHGERIVEVSYFEGCYYYGGDGFSDEYIFNGSRKEILGNIYDGFINEAGEYELRSDKEKVG